MITLEMGKEIDRLLTMGEDGRVRLCPEEILDVARDPANPLHQCFEWDDAKAARALRLGAARRIRRVVVQ